MKIHQWFVTKISMVSALFVCVVVQFARAGDGDQNFWYEAWKGTNLGRHMEERWEREREELLHYALLPEWRRQEIDQARAQGEAELFERYKERQRCVDELNRQAAQNDQSFLLSPEEERVLEEDLIAQDIERERMDNVECMGNRFHRFWRHLCHIRR